MDSIEGAYIGISRHILAAFPDLSWWPAWYGGIPFENSYPPLLHVIVALAAAIAPFSVARSHHIVTGLFYCLGPVFAYLTGCWFVQLASTWEIRYARDGWER